YQQDTEAWNEPVLPEMGKKKSKTQQGYPKDKDVHETNDYKSQQLGKGNSWWSGGCIGYHLLQRPMAYSIADSAIVTLASVPGPRSCGEVQVPVATVTPDRITRVYRDLTMAFRALLC